MAHSAQFPRRYEWDVFQVSVDVLQRFIEEMKTHISRTFLQKFTFFWVNSIKCSISSEIRKGLRTEWEEPDFLFLFIHIADNFNSDLGARRFIQPFLIKSRVFWLIDNSVTLPVDKLFYLKAVCSWPRTSAQVAVKVNLQFLLTLISHFLDSYQSNINFILVPA